MSVLGDFCKKLRQYRAFLASLLFVAGVLFVLLALFSPGGTRVMSYARTLPGTVWAWLLILMPPILVFQHALYIGFIKGRALRPTDQPTRFQARPEAWSGLQDQWANYFRPEMVLLRYCVPALLLGSACLLIYGLFYGGWPIPWLRDPRPELLLAGRVGAAGAYASVLIYLGLRSYRSDLTSGGATWCVVTILLGPGLAILAGMVVKLQNQDGFVLISIYFLAGIAPRRMVEWIADSARKTLGSQHIPLAVLNNKELLGIRGITPDIAARLEEEGIEDAYGLAMAEPYQLFRNTSFAPSQILAWMDEALLYYFLPSSAEELIRKKGITGAIDLAHLGYLAQEGDSRAKQAVLDLTPLLMGEAQAPLVLQRLREDAQVSRIWGHYNQLDTPNPWS